MWPNGSNSSKPASTNRARLSDCAHLRHSLIFPIPTGTGPRIAGPRSGLPKPAAAAESRSAALGQQAGAVGIDKAGQVGDDVPKRAAFVGIAHQDPVGRGVHRPALGVDVLIVADRGGRALKRLVGCAASGRGCCTPAYTLQCRCAGGRRGRTRRQSPQAARRP